MKAKPMKGEEALAYIAAKRPAIAAALASLEAERGGELAWVPGEGAEGISRIAEFCLRGKMIRGCLVILGAEAAGDSDEAERLPRLAAAMELFQAGLLAHDDIMDRDSTRRGAPTVHARYAAEALAAGSMDYAHIGEALGICLGDLCYFEAFGILARALDGEACAAKISALCAGILSEVAVAQMADVRWGASDQEIGEAEILAMYRCKTARYTFSLPLAAGALAAGAEELVGPLTSLGEELGILFQLRDDELGLFGDEAATGKSRGSDLREGKKTLFRSRLLAAAGASESRALASLFGGARAPSEADLAYVERLARELGVAASIQKLSETAASRARAILGELGLAPRASAVLDSLVDYVSARDR